METEDRTPETTEAPETTSPIRETEEESWVSGKNILWILLGVALAILLLLGLTQMDCDGKSGGEVPEIEDAPKWLQPALEGAEEGAASISRAIGDAFRDAGKAIEEAKPPTTPEKRAETEAVLKEAMKKSREHMQQYDGAVRAVTDRTEAEKQKALDWLKTLSEPSASTETDPEEGD